MIIHTAFIGDIVLTTPLIRRLKTKYPDSHLAFLTTPRVREILRNNPLLDQIIIFDKRNRDKGFKGFMRLCKALKAQ